MSLNIRQVPSETGPLVPRTLHSKPGTNIGGAGEHNRRVVMHVLRVNQSMSRAQIARGTGLAPQTVSNIMDELERDGLVVAAEPVKGGRGQPATPYSLAPHGAFAFGVQIDQHRARVAAVDLLGKVVAQAETALGLGGLQANLSLILATLRTVSNQLNTIAAPAAPHIIGLGLAMPAPSGVHAVRDDPWMVGLTTTHPMVDALQQATGLTVSLHHDASAAAMAERLNGRLAGLDDFVLIFVSYGIGAGIYARGEVYRGHHRLAGELGLVTVQGPRGPLPLERYAGLGCLYDALGLSPSQPDLFHRLEAAVTQNDPAIIDWLATASHHLVWAIDLIECLIDPGCVVIGGQMPALLMTRLMQAINTARPILPTGAQTTRPTVLEGSADAFSVAAGAAADPIARAFDPSFSAMMKSVG